MKRHVKETVLRREALCAGWRIWRDFAPVVEGKLRRLCDDPGVAPRVGARLVVEPRPAPLGVQPGDHLRFVVDGITAWLKVERVLREPARLVVKLLAVTSAIREEDDAIALDLLRDVLLEHGAVETPPNERLPAALHVPGGMN